jgi:hypothetical protein
MVAAALTPSPGVVRAVGMRARGYRRRSGRHRRHRRKLDNFNDNFRQWRQPQRRQSPACIQTANTTPWEGERAAAAVHKRLHAEKIALLFWEQGSVVLKDGLWPQPPPYLNPITLFNLGRLRD